MVCVCVHGGGRVLTRHARVPGPWRLPFHSVAAFARGTLSIENSLLLLDHVRLRVSCMVTHPLTAVHAVKQPSRIQFLSGAPIKVDLQHLDFQLWILVRDFKHCLFRREIVPGLVRQAGSMPRSCLRFRSVLASASMSMTCSGRLRRSASTRSSSDLSFA